MLDENKICDMDDYDMAVFLLLRIIDAKATDYAL